MTPEISVVIPVYNEEESLPSLFSALYPVMKQLGRSFEIIFINDGSRDSSLGLLYDFYKKYPEVRVIDLNGNFGQHMAIMDEIYGLPGVDDATLPQKWLDGMTNEWNVVTVHAEMEGMHHQVVNHLAPDLEIIAQTRDGLVEGVAMPSSYVVGVQWHPECLSAADPLQAEIFSRLVTVARN